jgi:hypothetical protein
VRDKLEKPQRLRFDKDQPQKQFDRTAAASYAETKVRVGGLQ